MKLTEDTKHAFLQLVVEKSSTACWSWAGEHDADFRPLFRGEKAYRVMYELRVGDVPPDFHVHHKCENSACVNPRHLVALWPEAHRAVQTKKPVFKHVAENNRRYRRRPIARCTSSMSISAWVPVVLS
jgi:HNH endonuclease